MFMINAIKRAVIVALGLILQFGFSIVMRLFFYKYLGIINIFYSLISILIVLGLLKNSTRLSNDLPWIILILIFPIFGTILLITLGKNYSKNKLLRNIFKYENKYKDKLIQDPKVAKEVADKKLDNIQYLLKLLTMILVINFIQSY